MTKCILEVLFFLAIQLNFSLSAYIGPDVDRDSLETRDDTKHTRFTDLELSCFAKEQIPYGENCYSLLTRGPCDVGEWFILDVESATQEEPQLIGVCAEKQCNNNDIYLARDDYCYNVTEGNSNLCPQRGTYLHVDVFGEGICDCKQDAPYVRWFTSDEQLTFQCYEANTRGPCNEYFIVVKEGTQVFCREDPCIDYHRNGVRFAYWKEDRRCYGLDTRGPCPKDHKFVIHRESKVPGCVPMDAQPLHLVNLPSVCKTDHAGECVDEVKFSGTSDKFANQLIQIANEKKKKAAVL